MNGIMSAPVLYIVLPCYNEEAILPSSIDHLTQLYGELISNQSISDASRLLFVNDGSADNTWNIIEEASGSNPYVCGVKLAKNVGHQNAILAGMESAKEHADVVVTIDADLQDDITKIPEMLQKFAEGADIVYGVKNERKADSFFKRTTALLFYRLMNALGVHTVYNHADFRLMSKRAIEALSRYRERNLFLRGIIPQLGYRTDTVLEDLREREAGESKYTLSKMMNLAVDGITSFTIKPVRLIFTLGMVFVLLAVIMLIYVICVVVQGKTVAGWASLMLSMWFIGGCILIGLGIVGEYVGKIYLEVKDRPRYNIEKEIIR